MVATKKKVQLESADLKVRAVGRMGFYGEMRHYPVGDQNPRAGEPFYLIRAEHYSWEWMEALGWDPANTVGVRKKTDTATISLERRDVQKPDPRQVPAGKPKERKTPLLTEARGRAADQSVEAKNDDLAAENERLKKELEESRKATARAASAPKPAPRKPAAKPAKKLTAKQKAAAKKKAAAAKKRGGRKS